MINFTNFKSEVFEIHIVEDQKPNYTVSIKGDLDPFSDGTTLPSDAINNALIVNLEQELLKKVLQELFKPDPISLDINSIIKSENRESRLSEILENEKVRVKHPTQIFEESLMEQMFFGEDRSKFMIMGAGIGTTIQDCIAYRAVSKEGKSTSVGSFYSCGLFQDSEVYIDSFMKFNDKRIAIISDKIKVLLSTPIFGDNSVSLYHEFILPEFKVLEIDADISFGF